MSISKLRQKVMKFYALVVFVCLIVLNSGPVPAAEAQAIPSNERLSVASTKAFLARSNRSENLEVGAAGTGFHIGDRYLLDANGNNFIMRGINHSHTWYPAQTGSFASIKATRANTIRVVLSSGKRWTKNSASDVANVINLCKTNKLVCVLEVHDTSGYGEQAGAASLAQAITYWKGVKSVLIGQEAYVIINIGNEPYGNNNTTAWVNDTKNAIAKMRSAGFRHTLMVDAPNWGQDWQFVMRDNAAGILASDPNGNTIFSIHMYGVFDTEAKVRDYISAFITAGLPLVIGEFGPFQPGVDYSMEDIIMDVAEDSGIGYLGWSWSGNSNDVKYLDMVKSFNPAQVKPWGNDIVDGENGIRRTSCTASVYDNIQSPKVCAIIRIGANPTKAQSVDFSVKFSEAMMDVGLEDFTILATGVLGATVTNTTGYNDSYYKVTIDTGSGNGTLRLTVPVSATITDLNSNLLQNLPFITSQIYTIGKPPLLVGPTNGETLLHKRPTFDWSDFPSAAKYKIQVSKDSTFAVPEVNAAVTDSTYTPSADLSADKEYFWRVSVQVGATWSLWSETWSFTTGNPPSIPVLVSPSNKALTKDYTPLLDWNDSTGANFHHYEVQIDTDKLFADPVLIKDATLITSSYTPGTDLAANSRYFWRVRSFNTTGQYSSWSTVWMFYTALPKPGNLTPQGGETVSSRRPALNWDVVDGASGYSLQLSTSSSFATLLVNSSVTTNTFTPSTKLPANTTIYWRVRAMGTHGPSNWSTASFHTP